MPLGTSDRPGAKRARTAPDMDAISLKNYRTKCSDDFPSVRCVVKEISQRKMQQSDADSQDVDQHSDENSRDRDQLHEVLNKAIRRQELEY